MKKKQSTEVTTTNNLKTKDELLEIMNDHLSQQQEFAERLREKAKFYVDAEGTKDEDTKKKNHYLSAYNTQVDAVSRTTSAMIKIYGSQLKTSEEAEQKQQEEKHDSLVD